MNQSDTIAAISTPSGSGGIAVVRISGPEAVDIVGKAWHGADIAGIQSHKATLGKYYDTSGQMLDEAVAVVFRAPNSFTGEDVVEISLHGSRWIQREVISDLIRRGARPADRGEFTQRAFMNGRIDLAQAEGVADLIASSSRASHRLALSQTRGSFSKELNILRGRLVEFASLLELELDFSEEDVEFADRSKLLELAETILQKIDRLASSYSSGAALKEGVPVAIAGIPNAGKSSLLNLITGDEKAIVTDIPGTTRDVIEDTLEIDGVLYRFMDTAGLRESDDAVESIGIDRARQILKKASIAIWMIDATAPLTPQIEELQNFRNSKENARIILLANKSDSVDDLSEIIKELPEAIPFSAKTGKGIDDLRSRLSQLAYDGYNPEEELIVTNARHYESLTRGSESLRRAIEAIQTGISADFIAQDVRETLHHLGTITGDITTADLLQNIFQNFCIGK